MHFFSCRIFSQLTCFWVPLDGGVLEDAQRCKKNGIPKDAAECQKMPSVQPRLRRTPSVFNLVCRTSSVEPNTKGKSIEHIGKSWEAWKIHGGTYGKGLFLFINHLLIIV